MINELRLRWIALTSAGPTEPSATGLRILDLPGPEAPTFVHLDSHGVQHVLIESDHVVQPVEALGLSVAMRQMQLPGQTSVTTYVDLGLADRTLGELFDHYAASVLESLSSDEPPSVTATRVLNEWRHFLSPSTRPLTPAGLGPLFAELSVLLDLCRLIGDACDCWRGAGARHDFAHSGVAIEVKSTRAHEARRVTVNGLDQLEPPEGGDLHVAFVRLEASPGEGASVPELVEAIVAIGVPRLRVYEALARAGLSATDLPGCEDFRFTVRERALIPVGDPFPRLLASDLAGGSLPLGVSGVTYMMDLDSVIERRLDGDAADAALRRFAAGAT